MNFNGFPNDLLGLLVTYVALTGFGPSIPATFTFNDRGWTVQLGRPSLRLDMTLFLSKKK